MPRAVKGLTSVILNAYDQTKVQRHTTMACLEDIRRFTDPPYEIIVVDNEPKFPIRDEYGVLNLETVIVLEPKQTVYESYNIGVRNSLGEYLVFIQNDVFVHERTINRLVAYLNEFDAVWPQQVPITREQTKESYWNHSPNTGGRDAGMVAITRKAFKKAGGWDGRFRNLLGEKAFYLRMDKAGLSWTDHTDALITHITAGTNLDKEEKLYAEEMGYDAELIKKYYD